MSKLTESLPLLTDEPTQNIEKLSLNNVPGTSWQIQTETCCWPEHSQKMSPGFLLISCLPLSQMENIWNNEYYF